MQSGSWRQLATVSRGHALGLSSWSFWPSACDSEAPTPLRGSGPAFLLLTEPTASAWSGIGSRCWTFPSAPGFSICSVPFTASSLISGSRIVCGALQAIDCLLGISPCSLRRYFCELGPSCTISIFPTFGPWTVISSKQFVQGSSYFYRAFPQTIHQQAPFGYLTLSLGLFFRSVQDCLPYLGHVLYGLLTIHNFPTRTNILAGCVSTLVDRSQHAGRD